MFSISLYWNYFYQDFKYRVLLMISFSNSISVSRLKSCISIVNLRDQFSAPGGRFSWVQLSCMHINRIHLSTGLLRFRFERYILCITFKISVKSNYSYLRFSRVSGFFYSSGVSGFFHCRGVSGFLYCRGVSGFLYCSGVSGFLHCRGVSGFLHCRGVSGFLNLSGVSSFLPPFQISGFLHCSRSGFPVVGFWLFLFIIFL